MQDYEAYTKEELIKEVQSLQRLNRELLQTFQETEQMEFAWTGNLGQWFWDFTVNEVTFNALKTAAIGYQKADLPEKVPYQFFTEKIHPDDYAKVMDEMEAHLAGETPVWEVKYRIQAKDGSWRVYHDRGKVTARSETGEPLFLKGIVFDVTEEEAEKESLLQKNHILENKVKIDSLTSLYTRPAMLLELGKSVNEAKKHQQSFSFVFLQINIQSKYEEDFALTLSEEKLKEIAKHILEMLHGDSFAGRYQEQLFMLVLKNTSPEEAYETVEVIRRKALHNFLSLSENLVVNAGVSVYDPTKTISELIQETTQKLVAAQRKGGNKTVMQRSC